MVLAVLCDRCHTGCSYRVAFHTPGTGTVLSARIVDGDAVMARLFVEGHCGPFRHAHLA